MLAATPSSHVQPGTERPYGTSLRYYTGQCGGMLAVAPEGEEGPRSSPDWARRAMSAQTDPAPAPSPTGTPYARDPRPCALGPRPPRP
eukprot:2521903-Rhodomonas_salina.1